MLEREKLRRDAVEIVNTDEMVPQDHLLRKIDAAVDFDLLYGFVEALYCEDNGRPSVDPVVLFKIVLIQHLYGIPSLRRTMQEINMNIAYRWFLGYTLNEELPHFSTVSYNFKHRFTQGTVEQIFSWILEEANGAGYLAPEAVFVDGTHIKANANINKKVKAAVPEAAKRYAAELMEEVNADREAHGKSRLRTAMTHRSRRKSETIPRKRSWHDGKKKQSSGRSPSPRQTRKAVCSKRANTKSALPTRHIRPATSTVLFWMLKSLRGMSMTAWHSMKSTIT